MQWTLFAVESYKLGKRRLLWGGTVLGSSLFLLVVVLVTLICKLSSSPHLDWLASLVTWPGGLDLALKWTSFWASGLMIILTSSFLAHEYVWRMMHHWLSHGVGRSRLLTAKALLLLVVALGLTLTLALIGGGVTALASLLLHGSLDVSHINWIQQCVQLLIIWYTMLPYLALTLFLAVMSRSVVVSMSVCLLVKEFLEGIIITAFTVLGGTLGNIAHVLPGGLSDALASSSRGNSPLLASLGIALYTLAFFLLALWTLHRQDLGN